jgi:hypothetical protein
MIAKSADEFSSAYAAWFGKSVILRFAVIGGHIPIPCNIVGESAVAVRIRVASGWELDLRKASILAVEQRTVAADTLIN